MIKKIFLFQNNKIETPSLPEETPEELAQVISPEPQHRSRVQSNATNASTNASNVVSVTQKLATTDADAATPKDDSLEHVTLLSIGHGRDENSLDQDNQHSKC